MPSDRRSAKLRAVVGDFTLRRPTRRFRLAAKRRINLGTNSMLRAVTLLASLLLALPAAAQVTVTDPWVRGTVSGQMATGAFMKLTSARDAKLVEARSPVAGVVEIHEMAIVDNVMRMRAVPALDLPAGRTIELKPGGYHVMLMDLKEPMAEGRTVPVTLIVETAGKRESIEVNATVRALTAHKGPPRKSSTP
jgi:copper(I)-binding protein